MNRPSWQQIQEFKIGRPSLGKMIRERRCEQQKTILRISREAGVLPTFWSEMEHDRRWPEETMVPFMAEFFDTTPSLWKQTVERYRHDVKKWFDKHREVVDWLKRMTRDAQADRTLVLR